MPSLRWNPPKTAAQQTAVFGWTAAHSAAVHQGAVLKNGGIITARPWTRYALQQIDLSDIFADNYRRSNDFKSAFKATANIYDAELRNAITSSVWQWPGLTKRQNGQTVGSPRDIVDTGELRDSQYLRFER